LRAQQKILIKGAENCGKNEPTSVSITKLQKQASISLNNGRGPTPEAGISACYLTLYAAEGWINTLALEVRPQFLLCITFYFSKIFPSQCFGYL